MSTHSSLTQGALGALTALALILLLGWMVRPALAAPAKPLSGAPAAPAGFDGQSPLNIPAAAFRPDGGTNTHYYYTFGGGYLYGTDPVHLACVMAPVYLPVGAVIDHVYASVVDNDATPDWVMEFRRLDVLHGTNMLLASFSTSSHGTAMQNPGAYLTANNVVPNQYYTFYFDTCLTNNERLYGVRVYYDAHQLFNPLISR